MIAWSWRRSCLRDIANQSAQRSWWSYYDLMPNVPNYRLIKQSTYSTWRCARQQHLKRYPGHFLYRRVQFEDVWHPTQCRSICFVRGQDRHLQRNESKQSTQLESTAARVLESSQHLALRKTKRTDKTKHSSVFIGIASLKSFDQRQQRLSWLERKLLRRREYKSQQSPIIWKRYRVRSSLDENRLPLRSRSIDPRIQALVFRGLAHWYLDTDHIYRSIIRDGSRSITYIPEDLLKFDKYVRNGSIYQAWMRRSWRGKAVWWRHALYYALLFSPSDALRIVADISKRTYLQIPGRIMSDTLLLLDASYVVDNVYQQSTYTRIALFHKVVCTYLSHYTKREGRAFLSWCIIRRLSKVLEKDHLTQLVRLLASSKTEYQIYTKLHTMYRYLELNALNNALDLFKTLTTEELQNRAVQSFCVTVLRAEWQTDNLHTFRQELTTFFVKQGIVPNCTLRNVILQNYLEAGDRQSAFALLESIRNKGLATSDSTYAIFLKYTSVEDASTIAWLYRMAVEDRVLPTSTFLAGYFVQIAALGRFISGQNSFSALLALYETLFDTVDLESFGVLEASGAVTGEASRLSNPSSSFALQWILASWIHENRGTPEKLISAYNNYQFHLRNNHPRIAKLASSAHIATAFVFAFGQHKSYLHMCTKVLQDMLQPEKPIPPPGIEKQESVLEDDPNVPDHERFLEPKVPQYAKHAPLPFKTPVYRDWDIWESLKREPFSYKVAPPGTATWNALLTVLLHHHQFDAAEGVIKAMQQAGFQANQITWNILIRGFASRHRSLQGLIEQIRNDGFLQGDESNSSLLSHATKPILPDDSGTALEMLDKSTHEIEDDIGIPLLEGIEAGRLNYSEASSVLREMASRL